MRRSLLLVPITLLIVLLVFAAMPGFERVLRPPCPSPGSDFGTFLSWTGDPSTTITISWFTTSLRLNAFVEYAPVGSGTGVAAKARAMDVSASCTQYRYVATLRNLQPGTQYSYRVVLDSAPGLPHTFRTAPAGPDSFTFLAVADMGTTRNASVTLAAMANQSFDFVIHPGDISYAGANQTNWTRWFAMVSPIASEHPYMVVPGNHENGSVRELRMFRERFSVPLANYRDPDRWGMYYSFNYSLAHFVGLKSDFPKLKDVDNHSHEVLPSDPNWDPLQTEWIRGDLERAANDTLHPWIIVFFHFPLFTSTNLTANWFAARQVWGGLFDRYHVNLVIQGHKHNYERTYPVWSDGRTGMWRNRTLFVDPGAPVYIVTGGGGEPLQPFGPPQAWTAKRNKSHEFLRVAIDGGRMEVAAIFSGNGSVLDRFIILRPGLSLAHPLHAYEEGDQGESIPLASPGPPPGTEGVLPSELSRPDLRGGPSPRPSGPAPLPPVRRPERP